MSTTKPVPALSATAARLLDETERHLAARRPADAARTLAGAVAIAPDHPEVLRAQGVLALRRGDAALAVAALGAAVARLEPDVGLLDQWAHAQLLAGDAVAAEATWRRACDAFPDSAQAWFNLASHLNAQARIDAAIEPMQRCIALAPDNRVARVMAGDMLAQLGRIDEAVAQYREVLRPRPDTGHAWWGLANLKTVRFDANDIAAMRAAMARADLPEHHRAVLGFALGKAHEDNGDHADAHATLVEANARMRRVAPWNAGAFRNAMHDIRRAFASTIDTGSSDLGHEALFIVSLPRSGSTLVEQVLAAHPDVEGAGELADLEAVIRTESTRRGMAFPAWVASTSMSDWQRLGQTYLDRTARWRRTRPRFTDKMPGNWVYAGAIRAMLPGARIVDCRRDAVETAWSCFKQLFAGGQAFSYDLADIADYSKVHAQTMDFWSERSPEAIRTQHYERLVADPEREIRALLAFCGLSFDPACLVAHESQRVVRTPSAAQVRSPLRATAGRTAGYGTLLDGLRRNLAD